MDTKICCICKGDPKPISDFYKKRTNPNGKVIYKSFCKICNNKMKTNWCANNRDKERLRKKNGRLKWKSSLRKRKKTPEQTKRAREIEKKNVTNTYIKKLLLSKLHPLGIKFKDISPDLILLKRKEQLLKQKIKQHG
jgi:hypothetical protein